MAQGVDRTADERAIKLALVKVANTVELKNQTNRLLRHAMRGEPVIITLRGKPAASLTALAESDLEDFVLEHSPRVRQLLAEAEADLRAGRVLGLERYRSRPRSR